MKKYMVYLDDGKGCLKIAVPGNSKQDAKNYVAGNGEIIAIKDITEDFPIDLDKVSEALRRANFGEIEIDLITRCLIINKIC